METGRSVWIWLACALSLTVLCFGAWTLATFVRFGLVSPILGLLLVLVLLISIGAVFFLLWWGLLLALAVGVWLLGFSALASMQAAVVVIVFYAPLALVAFAHHRRFRW